MKYCYCTRVKLAGHFFFLAYVLICWSIGNVNIYLSYVNECACICGCWVLIRWEVILQDKFC